MPPWDSICKLSTTYNITMIRLNSNETKTCCDAECRDGKLLKRDYFHDSSLLKQCKYN